MENIRSQQSVPLEEETSKSDGRTSDEQIELKMRLLANFMIDRILEGNNKKVTNTDNKSATI
ncbi:MAG: hypothetical protein KBD36_06595 [Alphaproteobacteria bacterium]|nr:hypothetical protein [Alphaproteobacteria bacterium]